MEYITPLMYRKILDVLTYIYTKSTYDKTYDLFRLKDVLDSFSEGQIMNKMWAAEELNKVIDDSYKECIVIGSWYGLFAHVFIESGFTKRVLNVELDKMCNEIAHMLNIHDNSIFKHTDGMQFFWKQNYADKIIVCTACEHIDQDELFFAMHEKNPDMLVCLQSNNYYEVDSHINCKDTLEDFVNSLPLRNILYSGTKRYKDEYDRFMVIGK